MNAITTVRASSSTTAAATAAAASVVVQNDKTSAIAVTKYVKVHVKPFVTPTPAAASARVLALVEARKAWETGAYLKSNNELYGILGKCYALYFDLRGNDKASKAARTALNDLMSKSGLKFKETTHMLTRLVNFVFGENFDRRRVSTYGLVLRAALADEIEVDGIAAFIVKGGGVEQIRRRTSETAITPKQKAALGKQAVEQANLAVIESDTLGSLAGDASEGDDLLAIVTLQADGSFVVRALVTNKTLVNAAMASVYSSNKAVVENVKRSNKAANDDKTVDELINEALAA